MHIHQISLFLENEPGHLASLTRTLADGGVNIVTLALADTEQFGILRLIVSDWRKAKKILEDAGKVVRVTDVLATEVPDVPGGLARVLDVLDRAKVNVEYMYAFTFRRDRNAILVFRFDHAEAAEKALVAAGVKIIGEEDMLARA